MTNTIASTVIREDIGNVSLPEVADKIEAYILEIFSIQEKLQHDAPDFNWRGLGNLLGDYGEYLAIKHYEITPANRGAADIDARTADTETVQIKTCLHFPQIGFRGKANKLLVLKIADNGTHSEIYNGDFPDVVSSHSTRDSKFTLTIAQLAKLNNQAKGKIPQRAVPEYPSMRHLTTEPSTE